MKSITRVFLWGSLVLAVVLAGCVANPSRDGAAAAESGDYASAISALRPGAEQGDAESEWRLGAAYANAEPPLKDLAEAERWTRKAADQGYVPAMVDMAQLNLFYKPEKDEKAAADWYRKAADRGHPEAQFWMGMFHYSGDGGVNKDYTAAYM